MKTFRERQSVELELALQEAVKKYPEELGHIDHERLLDIIEMIYGSGYDEGFAIGSR